MPPKKVSIEKITKTKTKIKNDIEKDKEDSKEIIEEKNNNIVNDTIFIKIIDNNSNENPTQNLDDDIEENMPEKPLHLKNNSKFYISEEHYLNLDKSKFSQISNTDLTSLLFLRLLNSGNPLAKYVISIHRALIDPINYNLQNLENYRQSITNRTENSLRNKDKYNKNREIFDNSKQLNNTTSSNNRFRKFNNSDKN
jgi:hypothetical protein